MRSKPPIGEGGGESRISLSSLKARAVSVSVYRAPRVGAATIMADRSMHVGFPLAFRHLYRRTQHEQQWFFHISRAAVASPPDAIQ
jgi:hypothetical protein